MKVLEIKEIVRKNVPLYYRMCYSGVVYLELAGRNMERRIDFIVETTPTGDKAIRITQVDPIDYPLVPLNRELKRYILNLSEEGNLPV
jgi:hypothetical protein